MKYTFNHANYESYLKDVKLATDHKKRHREGADKLSVLLHTTSLTLE